MRISDWSSDVCSSDLFPQLLVRGASLAALTSVGQDIVQALFARAHVHAFPVSSRSRSATLRAASILRLCLVISPRSAAAWRLRRLATACSARCRSGLQPNISSGLRLCQTDMVNLERARPKIGRAHV